jgi:hypothetical protein
LHCSLRGIWGNLGIDHQPLIIDHQPPKYQIYQIRSLNTTSTTNVSPVLSDS